MSSTVAKALTLLDFFSEEQPELGLSDLARKSKIDKATVHRMLSVMSDAGLVEQRSETKLYRLGAGILRLASIREACFPVTSILEDALEELTNSTGETAHASMISGKVLATVGIRESHKSSRVSLEEGQALLYHGTASGLATLAFSEDTLVDRVLSTELEKHTEFTDTDPEVIRNKLKEILERGYSIADQTYEEDVYGIAAPLFDQSGIAIGALAVATPAHRITDDVKQLIVSELTRVAKDVTSRIGGRLSKDYLKSNAGRA